MNASDSRSDCRATYCIAGAALVYYEIWETGLEFLNPQSTFVSYPVLPDSHWALPVSGIRGKTMLPLPVPRCLLRSGECTVRDRGRCCHEAADGQL